MDGRQQQITGVEIVNALIRILSPFYDLRKDAELLGETVPLMAQSRLTVQHYALSKKLILEQSHLSDSLFFWIQTTCPPFVWFAERFHWLREVQQNNAPEPGHFRSRFIGIVLIPDAPVPSLRRQLSRYHHFRWLRFGFNGMSESFLLTYAWAEGKWYGNRRGREFASLFARLNRELQETGQPIQEE